MIWNLIPRLTRSKSDVATRPVVSFVLQHRLAVSGGIETVRSWDHYREIMIADGKTAAEADAAIDSMLSSLTSMDRSAGSDRIGVPAPSFQV